MGRGSWTTTVRAVRQLLADWRLASTRLADDALRLREDRVPWRRIVLDWREELSTDFVLAHGDAARSGGDGRGKPTVVVVEENFPDPTIHSGAYRLTNAMNLALDLGYRVVFVSLRDRKRVALEEPLDDVTDLKPAGTWTVGELFADLNDAVVVWVCRPYPAARIVSVLRTSHVHQPETVVYYPMDMHHVRLRRWGEHAGSRRLLWRARVMRLTERTLVKRSDKTVVPTAEEERTVKTLDPAASVYVIPTIHEPAAADVVSLEGRRGLLFYGGFAHIPNVDAVEFLVRDVLPRIRQDCPDVTLTIAGSDPHHGLDWLRELDDERVEYVGWLPDLDALVDQSRVMIAPLRFGAGMKGKIGYAIARGLPVVTTTIGDEGFRLAKVEPRLVADDADGLAASSVWLLRDDDAWKRCSTVCHDASLAFAPSRVMVTVADVLRR